EQEKRGGSGRSPSISWHVPGETPDSREEFPRRTVRWPCDPMDLQMARTPRFASELLLLGTLLAVGSPGSPVGQAPSALLADIVYDPFVEAEKAETGGSLLVHYAVPLLDGNDVYMEFKTGAYVPCQAPGSGMPFPCGPDAWGTQIWNVEKLTWRDGGLVPAWTFQSDWKPEPAGGAVGNWEPLFLPALSGDFVYVPGFGGTVFKVSKADGTLVSRINPFGTPLDAGTFVAGGLAADGSGNVFYNALRLDTASPWTGDALGAWLVKISPGGPASRASFSTLVPGAPPAPSARQLSFAGNRPWPPSVTAVAPRGSCGGQRPGINVVPAVAPDGTIYTASRAHFNGRYGYLVAVNPDLSRRWSASLRGILKDGCGVGLPA